MIRDRIADFDLGTKNFDDDFHTDYIFIKYCIGGLKETIGVKHEELYGEFINFNSYIFFQKKSTKNVCDALISKIQKDELSIEKINLNILKRSNKLACVYDLLLDEKKLLSNLDLYRNQLNQQLALYQYAWLNEILEIPDYGIKKIIFDLLTKKGIFKEDLQYVYNTLIQPEMSSVYTSENNELVSIAEKCTSLEHDIICNTESQYLQYTIKQDIYKSLMSTYNKFKWLSYHGYSDRPIMSFVDYISKFKNIAINLSEFHNKEKRRKMSIKSKHHMLKILRLTDKEKSFLKAYSNISSIKSVRRLAQLKNFYYLDKQLASFATILNVPIVIIKYLTPWELIDCMKGIADISAYLHRSLGISYYYNGVHEKIEPLESSIAIEIENNKREQSTQLRGQVVNGKDSISGEILVINRHNSNIGSDYKDKIIISYEGDPDIMPIVASAKAVLTEQSGITSHIVVFALENNIPCIIGINNLLASVTTGNFAYIDFSKGEIILT